MCAFHVVRGAEAVANATATAIAAAASAVRCGRFVPIGGPFCFRVNHY